MPRPAPTAALVALLACLSAASLSHVRAAHIYVGELITK